MSNDHTSPERRKVHFMSCFLCLLLQMFAFHEQVVSKNSHSYEYGSVGDELK